MEVDKKTLFPPFRPGKCQQIHPFIIISYRDFRLTLLRDMLRRSGHEPQPTMPVGKPASASNNTGSLDTRHNTHWPGHSYKKRRFCLCSSGGVMRKLKLRRVKCDLELCVDRNSFEDNHTKSNFKTSIRPSSIQRVEDFDSYVGKITWTFTTSFRNLPSPLRSKEITAF